MTDKKSEIDKMRDMRWHRQDDVEECKNQM